MDQFVNNACVMPAAAANVTGTQLPTSQGPLRDATQLPASQAWPALPEPSAAEVARMTDEAVFAASASSMRVVRQMLSAGVELGFTAALDLGHRLARVLDSPSLSAGLRHSPDDAAAITQAAVMEAPGVAGYDPLQSALADVSPAGPWRRRYLDEIRYFLPFAVAAYGRSKAEVLACLRGAGVNTEDDDLLHAELVDRPLVPAHILVRDAARKAIVVSIRGTSSLRDIVRDAAATPEPMSGGATAHGGMAACADGLSHYKLPPTLDPRLRTPRTQPAGERSSEAPAAGATSHSARANCSVSVSAMNAGVAPAAAADTTVHSTPTGPAPPEILPPMESFGVAGVPSLLQRAVIAFPDHRIVFVGHSLGAGIAALLAMRTVRTVIVAAVKSAAVFRGGPWEVLHTVLTQYLVMPPRPIHVYCYAPPQCAGPELAALSSMSAADMDGAGLLRKAGSGGGALTLPVAAVMHHLVRSVAGDPSVAADWLLLRHLPLATSVVFQDDIVPRLSVASLLELHTRMATVRALAARASGEPSGMVPVVGPSPAARGWCAGCGCRPRAQAVSVSSLAPVASQHVATAQEPPASAASTAEGVAAPGTPTSCANAGAVFTAGSSVVMAPLAAADADMTGAAKATPAAPAGESAAAREAEAGLANSPMSSAAESATWDAGQLALAARLKAMGFPSATACFIVDTCGPGWMHPDQTLVVPGRIYHITSTQGAGGASGLMADSAALAEVPGPAAHPAAEALRRAFTVRRSTPMQLRHIVLSRSMMTDHATARYGDSLTVFMTIAGMAGEAEAEAAADGKGLGSGAVQAAAAATEASDSVGAGVGVVAQQGGIGSDGV
jgi:hypothetical protein